MHYNKFLFPLKCMLPLWSLQYLSMVLLPSHFPSAKPQNILLFSPSQVPCIQAVNGSHIFIFIFFTMIQSATDTVWDQIFLLISSAKYLLQFHHMNGRIEMQRGELTQGYTDILKQLGLESCVVVPQTINFPTMFSFLQRGATPSPILRGAANRSYPTSEVRGCGESARLQRRRSGREELSPAQGQGWWQGATPRPRSGGCASQEG